MPIVVYSHKYTQLPLIPVEQFLAEHPEHADADEVALTVARIEHEHAERLALEEQRQGLLKKKQGLIADNKKRKDDLANLDKDLEKFIDVCRQSNTPVMMLMFCNRLPNQSKRLSRRWSEVDVHFGHGSRGHYSNSTDLAGHNALRHDSATKDGPQ
jgi:hypothetical protein